MFRRGTFSKIVDTLAIGAIIVACSGGGSTNPPLPVGPGARVQADGLLPIAIVSPPADRGPSRDAAADMAAQSITPNTVTRCSSTGPCTGGENLSVGLGVAGVSARGRGVSGITLLNSTTTGQYGVFGQDASKSGSNDVGVYGVSVRGVGTSGLSTSNTGVRGTSTSGIGVAGTSSENVGVYGTTSTYIGVIGASDSYIGVYGLGGSYGVYAAGTSYGVAAYSDTGAGLWGISSTGTGVIASTGKGFAVDASSGSSPAAARIYNVSGNGTDTTGSYIGIVARTPSGTGTYPIVATDTSANDVFYVDGVGDVFYHGFLQHLMSTHNGEVTAFNPSSTRPAIEDTGTAHLVDGRATVALDATFAQAIDPSRLYQVFLTPDGDTRGLYVASKSGSSFVVREVQGGHGSFAFDYHIYASAVNSAGRHMTIVAPHAPLIQKQAPPKPPANTAINR